MKMSLCSLLTAAALLALPAAAPCLEISVDSTTILRIEQRDVSGTGKQNMLPATQFLGLDAGKLADGNLSLHFYGWGRLDLSDKSFNNHTGEGSLTYGYLQYRFKEANANLKAGRLFVHEGVINEQVDGVSAQSDLPGGFGVTAFGGATVHTRHLPGESSDGKGDGLLGARASYRYLGLLELGLSGSYESNAPTLVNFSNGSRRLMGGDIWFSPFRMVSLQGHTSFNTATRGVAEHSYQLNLKPTKELTLNAEFNEQHDRSYFYSWSLFSGAALNPSDRSRSLGGGASYAVGKNLEVSADYKHYNRELGDADRFGGEARWSFLDNSVRGGVAYHYLRAGDAFAISGTPSASYQQVRAFLMQDTKSYFGALDLIDYLFDKKVFNEKSAWEAVGSLGYHLTPALALSGDLSYGRNPEFSEEMRGLVRLTYSTAYAGKGDSK